MTGDLNNCFHNKLVYSAKLVSGLGLVPGRPVPVMRGPTVYE